MYMAASPHVADTSRNVATVIRLPGLLDQQLQRPQRLSPAPQGGIERRQRAQLLRLLQQLRAHLAASDALTFKRRQNACCACCLRPDDEQPVDAENAGQQDDERDDDDAHQNLRS